jgi:hypothetical protein
LAALSSDLRGDFSGQRVAGYVRGRTSLRDAVLQRLGCSELEAEQLVDTMVARGFIAFDGEPGSSSGGGAWRIV